MASPFGISRRFKEASRFLTGFHLWASLNLRGIVMELGRSGSEGWNAPSTKSRGITL